MQENYRFKPEKILNKAEPDLPRNRIPTIGMFEGKKYKFEVPKDGKGTSNRLVVGQVIQICGTHITFKHKLGYSESFHKCDLKNWGYQEV